MPRKKVLVVGPVGPTRGGIARHTERILEELLKHVDCEVYSDSRLFPNHLYPGEFQDASWLTTPQAPGLKIRRKRFPKLLLDLLRADLSNCAGALVIWWTAPLAPKFILTQLVLRLRGIKSVAFCHNAEPRSRSIPARLMSLASLSSVGSLLVQTQRDSNFLKNNLSSSKEIRVIGHPAYVPKSTLRNSQLNSRSSVKFLFFGHIRKYKGLETLLDSMQWINDTKTEIRIVGESWSQELTRTVFKAAQQNSEMMSHRLEFITDEEAEDELSAADVVVLPYLSATGSGVLAQAIGLNRPVIVSDIPELSELVRPGIDGWKFEAGNSKSLAETILLAGRAIRQAPMQPWEGNKSVASWERVAEEILGLLDCQH